MTNGKVHLGKLPKDKLAEELIRRLAIFDQNIHYKSEMINSLENAGAGLFLGRPHDLFEVRVVEYIKKNGTINEVDTGRFGEIIFRNKNFESWNFTGLIGFVDENKNCWCCALEYDMFEYSNEKFYPYCIEPMFESKWFVKKAAIVLFNKSIVLVIEPIWLFKIFFSISKKLVLKLIMEFVNQFDKLKKIQKFCVVKSLPLKQHSFELDRCKIIKLLHEQ